MYAILLELGAFDDLDGWDQKHTLSRHLWGLIDENVSYLRTVGRATPLLYESGVVFQREADGALNKWHDIRRCLELGHSHCVGLSCWRIAELRVRQGLDARPSILEFEEMRSGVLTHEFHVIVRLPDDTHEDPSRLLGMP